MKRNFLFLFLLTFIGVISYAQPSAPAGVTAGQTSPTALTATVNWTDLTGPLDAGEEVGFVVVIKKSDNSTSDSAVVGTGTTTRITVPLTPDTYTARVFAYTGTSPTFTFSSAVTSAPFTITAVVQATHNLVYEADQSTNSTAVFQWDPTASQNINGFEFEVFDVSAGQLFQLYANVPFGTPVFSVNGLKGLNNYRARVRPFVEGTPRTYGPWSNTVNWTTPPDPPAPPILEFIRACPTEVLYRIVKQGTMPVEEYVVQKAFSSSGPWFNFSSTNDGNPFIFDGEEQNIGRTVFYRVFSKNSSPSNFGLSQPSVVAQVDVPGYVPPPAPQNVRALATEIGPDQVTFRWDYPAALLDQTCGTNLIRDVNYIVTVNGVEKTRGFDFPQVQSLKVDGLNMKDTVAISVWYTSPQGQISPIVTFTTRTAGPPDAPINPGVQGFYDGIGDYIVRFFATDNSDDEDAFEIWIGTTPNTAEMKYMGRLKFAIGMGETVSFFQQPVEQGVQFYYAMRGVNYLGNGPFTPVITNSNWETEFSGAPNAPFDAKATVASTGTTVTWRDDSFNETYFVIERSTDGVAFDSIGTTMRNVTTFVDASGTTNSYRLYRVRAVNPKGSSAASKAVVVGTAPSTGTGSSGGDTTPSGGRLAPELTLYPNPTVDRITIDVPKELYGSQGQLVLVDQNARVVLSREVTLGENGVSIDMTTYKSGMYTFSLKTKDYSVSKKVHRF